MSKKRVTSPLITKMGTEVFELFASKTEFSEKAFHPAFRDVAHKHGIWHHKDAKEYNRFFKWVMDEVKFLTKKHNASRTKQKVCVPEQPDPQREIRIPHLDPGKLRYSLDLNF